MLRFGGYLLRFRLASDWSRNNKHSRNFLWCSRFYGRDCKADYPLFHWLIIGQCTSINLRWLWLGGQTVKNLHWLACKFDLDQSERRSTQVHARPGRTESQVDPSLQLASVGKSPDQTDSQVVASSGKLKLRRDFRWVDKRTGKFPHKYTQLANKPISRQTFLIFHWLMKG